MFKRRRMFSKSIFSNYLLPALILISCNQLTDESNKETISKGTQFVQVYKTFKEPECPHGNCAEIKITRIESEENHRINKFIDEKLSETILAFTRSEKANSLNQVADFFFNDYKEFKQAFPESRTSWELNIRMDVDRISSSKDWISLKVETYSYTGGAHPNTYTEYVNLTNKGKILRPKDWISDRQLLLQIAEDAFRKNKNISASQDLGDAGYTFEDKDFSLPQNIGFNDGKLILYYNDYEISSYAEGATVIEIPLKDLRNAVNF
jgi:hypothetical protein